MIFDFPVSYIKGPLKRTSIILFYLILSRVENKLHIGVCSDSNFIV